jgi:hypothetical protein
MPAVTLPSQFFGRAGHHTFSYSYSDQRATPFESTPPGHSSGTIRNAGDRNRIEFLDVFI